MVKRRRSKRTTKTKRSAVVALVLLAVLAGAVFLLRQRSRKTPPPKHARTSHEARYHAPRRAAPPNGREALQRFLRAMASAGGEDAWIKASPDSSGGPAEALFLPRARGAMDRAILRAASGQGLRLEKSRLAADQIEVTAYAGRDTVCRWQMREVPRIMRVAIVIDDLGQNQEAARELLRLRSPLTFSVMPRLAFSRQTAEAAHNSGIEVMLHLPMQPLNDSAPDISPHEIKVGMGRQEVGEIIATDLASVPYAAGVNNHMGSRATSDSALMSEVMTNLAARHLFYIDSRTSAGSVALAAARRSEVPSYYRSVFLDDTRTVPYTLGQLRRLCRVAGRHGVALAIGHPYPTTIAALRQFLPDLGRENIQLVPVSTLLRETAAARLAPGA